MALILTFLLACPDSPTPGDPKAGHVSDDTGTEDDSAGGDSGDDTVGDTAQHTDTDTDAADCPDGCDDGDACTTDACVDGACTHATFDGEPLDLWDMDLIRDPSTLDLEIVGTTSTWEGLTPVEVTEIRYTSYQSDGCTISPVRIEAYVAIPDGLDTPAAGVVVAHGLGGLADAGSASTPAAELGVVALAYSGPGQGASEGTGSTSDHLFDTLDDPRDSWFWEHPMAAMRGLTVLEALPDVDPGRLGMTGYSGGSVATWMVAGVDDRLAAAVPVSATGYLDLAIAATPNPGWEYDLLQAMTTPKTASDPEWLNYVRWLDPKNYLPTLHAPVLLVNGAQDEFFPVHSSVATMTDALAAQPESRAMIIANWDHGWYAYFTGDEAAVAATAGLDMWMGHHLGTNGDYPGLPSTPQVDSVSSWTCYDPDAWWINWTCSLVVASVPDLDGYEVESATFWFSVDNALTFTSWNLEEYSEGVWWAEVGTLDGAAYTSANTVWFVEFELADSWLSPSFTLTSLPSLPSGFSPYILPVDGPIP